MAIPPPPAEEPEEAEDWLTTYADAITLLMAFFVMLVSFAKVDIPSFEKVAAGIRSEIGNTEIPTPTEKMMVDLQDVVYTMQADKVVKVGTDDQGVVIELDSSAFYIPGSADIRPQAIPVLQKMGEAVMASDFANYVVEVEGHTDDDPISTPVYPSNWELSTGRATRVVRYLEGIGMDTKRLKASGFGASRPKIENRTAAGVPIPDNQAKNRRVVVRVYPVAEEAKRDESLKAISVDELGSDSLSGAGGSPPESSSSNN